MKSLKYLMIRNMETICLQLESNTCCYLLINVFFLNHHAFGAHLIWNYSFGSFKNHHFPSQKWDPPQDYFFLGFSGSTSYQHRFGPPFEGPLIRTTLFPFKVVLYTRSSFLFRGKIFYLSCSERLIHTSSAS